MAPAVPSGWPLLSIWSQLRCHFLNILSEADPPSTSTSHHRTLFCSAFVSVSSIGSQCYRIQLFTALSLSSSGGQALGRVGSTRAPMNGGGEGSMLPTSKSPCCRLAFQSTATIKEFNLWVLGLPSRTLGTFKWVIKSWEIGLGHFIQLKKYCIHWYSPYGPQKRNSLLSD